MPASIEDVAQRANVSISTVSRVLNRRNLVNTKTIERVEQAIKELGYRPNAFARGLMLRRSEVVGLVLPDLHGEFYSEIIRGANLKARELGYNLIISSTNDPDDARSLLEEIQQRTFMDGVAVMISELTGCIQEILGGFRLPFVVLDREIENAAHDSVIIDQREGALAMMRHLIHDCSARRIVFVGGLRTNVDTIARLGAYREALRESGRPCDEEDIHHLDYQYETAYAFAMEHVKTWSETGSCVFAANDEMASGIIDAANATDVDVPADLPVVGFDDTRIARMTRPPLTTVHVPMSQMGATAIELLCQRLTDPDLAARRVSLHPELIVRKSCGVATK